PVYFYYTLTKFFQNHRRYVASQDPVQYRDKWTVDAAGVPSTGSFSGCWPLESYTESIAGKEEKIYYYPCGLGALSFFNDTFLLQDSNSNVVPWTKEGISSRAGLKGRYASQSEAWLKQNSGRYNCWHNVSDEDFMVWMRPAASPDFWKLHRIIPNGLKAGTYRLSINVNFPVASFRGTKGFVLTNANTFGTDRTVRIVFVPWPAAILKISVV
ncbi:hypothetical protein GUITHDRAFT_56566, partial [Guillardia theta CCMP2712]